VNDRRDTFGQARALTVLTAIRDGHESELAHHLSALSSGDASPLAQVPGTHFARWVVIDDVVYEGEGDQGHLTRAQLLFTSNFDGEHAPYLEALRTCLGEAADAIWGHCAGYPGHDEPAAFARYLQSHRVESSLFFSAYGTETVDDVKRSLKTRHTLIDFALGAQKMGAEELQAAFAKAFGS
jgi:hypothetical protein